MALAAARLSLYGQSLILPLKPGSVRFAAIGDMGTGELPQYEIAREMNTFREVFHFDFVITLGDSLLFPSPPVFVRLFSWRFD